MSDAAIVMIENVHNHLQDAEKQKKRRLEIIALACREVGGSLFVSLLIITLSFLPVFALEAQEGRLFTPLAMTKTFAMAASALIAITLVPVLIAVLVRGRVPDAARNPVNRLLQSLFRPLMSVCLRHPVSVIIVIMSLLAVSVYPVRQLGTEFMPELEEGDLLYMPTTFPGISIGKAQELLQQTDRLIRTHPEVSRVFGKVGRAETATDPAPLTMIETTIQLKPQDQWRPGMSMERIRQELDERVQIPGVSNAWVMPIKNRIDMLATGIKTPVGIKISGPDLGVIQGIGARIESLVRTLPGTRSAYSERVASGRYLNIDIDRELAARFGMNIDDIHDVVRYAIGGMNITESVEGLERYPVNLRYPHDTRNSIDRIRNLPVITPMGATLPLSELATVTVEDGPALIKTENARLNGWIYVDVDFSAGGRDLGRYVESARQRVADEISLPPGYSVSWSGQYEYLLRSQTRLSVLIPLVLMIVILLLYLNFRRWTEVLVILITVPVALVGGYWLLYLLGYNMSVAVAVGFIALMGVAVEIGVVMLVYINQAVSRQIQTLSDAPTADQLQQAVLDGCVRRIRPVMMTVLTIIIGLLPVMLGDGTGSDIMRRIAAPVIGGMASATLMGLLVLPSVYGMILQRRYHR